jgi:hypothetical protein
LVTALPRARVEKDMAMEMLEFPAIYSGCALTWERIMSRWHHGDDTKVKEGDM